MSDEYAETLRSSTPVARTDHWCEWCKETIEVGLKHRVHALLFEGTVSNFRMHLECDDAYAETSKDIDGYALDWYGTKYPRGKALTEITHPREFGLI